MTIEEYFTQIFEQILMEKPDYYRNFGWVKPDGSYLDGDNFPKAKLHQDLLPKELKGRKQDDYEKAFNAGWVRHGQTVWHGDHEFFAGDVGSKNRRTIDKFIGSKRHLDMGGKKYRLTVPDPNDKSKKREINGDNKEDFLNTLETHHA